jgi:hypothetical protein
MRAAPTHEIAAQAVVDVAAWDVTTSKASGGGDMWVGASGARRKWQLFMKSPSERQGCESTRTVWS